LIYLVIAIVCNVLLGVIFKLFRLYKVDILPAIVVNYFVCTGIGFTFFQSEFPAADEILHQSWTSFALVLGGVFITGFVIAAYCVQYYGVALTTMMQKISLVVTVLFAIFFFKETSPMLKWIGLAFSIVAIILVNLKPKKDQKHMKVKWWVVLLPFVTFSFNALIDSTLFYVKAEGLNTTSDGAFTTILFGAAGLIGIIILIIRNIIAFNRISRATFLGGIILGIPNFFSIYFLLKTLQLDWGGSVIFPVFNISVILVASIVGFLIFKESMKWYNVLGLGMALLSIVLISIS
jgi:drug/metabolite transporter (DMT)-like permease